MSRHARTRGRASAGLVCAAALVATLACQVASPVPDQRTFASPEDAAKALIQVAKDGKLEELMKLLGPDAQRLVDSSDSKTARQNREVFVVAAQEGWRLTDNGANGRVLVVGYESWPFPIPLVADAGRWRFDTAAGVEEVLARRIGRNELAAIRASRTYVYAQRVYASRGHDSKPKGLYATALRSDPGRHNGLYWPATRGQPRSPLGDLIADAAGESSFHGYHFKILAPREPNGFALVAWPATYDGTGVMTFVVNQDGVVREKDLGSDTAQVAGTMTRTTPTTRGTA